jgi:hypothetical protein
MENARMRVGRAQDERMRHAGQREIVAEAPLPQNEAAVLDPAHRLPNAEASRRRHRRAPSHLSARTLCCGTR